MEVIKKRDPESLVKGADESRLLEQSVWKWANHCMALKTKEDRFKRCGAEHSEKQMRGKKDQMSVA